MTKVGVTGAGGRLGYYLVSTFKDWEGLYCDVTDKDDVKEELDRVNPDIIVHCAAFTDVDECEKECMRSHVMQVNNAGVINVRDSFDGRMILISTDYIFNGRRGPYREDAIPEPINYYGHTKLCGEDNFLSFDFSDDTIIRTTILYGGNRGKPDFVSSILNNLNHVVNERRDTFKVPRNLHGNPTYVPHLAEAIRHIVRMKNPPRIVNVCGKETLSRYEFACGIASAWGYKKDLFSWTDKIPGSALRPQKAGLTTHYAENLGIPIYSVLEGLESMRNGD